MEYESAFNEVGGFGRVQFLMFMALSFTNFKAVLDLELLVLVLHVPPFRCLQQNSSGYQPQEFGHHCSIGRQLALDNGSFLNVTERCELFEFTKDSVVTHTMVEEYSLVCGRQHYTAILVSVYFLGTAFGMLFGMLGDKIGRKRVLLVCGIGDIVTTVLPAFMPTLHMQLLARFAKGLPIAIYYQGMLILEEMTPSKHRAALGNMYWMFWCLGYMACGPIVYFLQEWKKIQLFSIVFCLNYFIIFVVVPESPRWLMLRGRAEEALAVMQRIAKWNGISWDHTNFKEISVKPESTGNTLEMFRYPVMRMKSFVIFYMLLMFAFCYFGLSTDSTFITSNIVINVVLNGAVEIPSSILGWLLSDKFGRKYTTMLITIVSGFCVIAVPLLPPTGAYGIAQAAVAMTGKCLLTTGYCIADVWAAEIFPTSVRNNGLFLAATLAMLGNIVAPQINALASVVKYLPGLIFGVFSIVSAFTALLLPETKGLPLPETVPGSESLVRGNEKEWGRRTMAEEAMTGSLLAMGGDETKAAVA